MSNSLVCRRNAKTRTATNKRYAAEAKRKGWRRPLRASLDWKPVRDPYAMARDLCVQDLKELEIEQTLARGEIIIGRKYEFRLE